MENSATHRHHQQPFSQMFSKGQTPLCYLVADRSEAGPRPIADLLAS